MVILFAFPTGNAFKNFGCRTLRVSKGVGIDFPHVTRSSIQHGASSPTNLKRDRTKIMKLSPLGALLQFRNSIQFVNHLFQVSCRTDGNYEKLKLTSTRKATGVGSPSRTVGSYLRLETAARAA